MLLQEGYDAVVWEGVYVDLDEERPIGHDWVVVNDGGREIILDGGAEQFRYEPLAKHYLGEWSSREASGATEAELTDAYDLDFMRGDCVLRGPLFFAVVSSTLFSLTSTARRRIVCS